LSYDPTGGGIHGLLPMNALGSFSQWWTSHFTSPFAWIEHLKSFFPLQDTLGRSVQRYEVRRDLAFFPVTTLRDGDGMIVREIALPRIYQLLACIAAHLVSDNGMKAIRANLTKSIGDCLQISLVGEPLQGVVNYRQRVCVMPERNTVDFKSVSYFYRRHRNRGLQQNAADRVTDAYIPEHSSYGTYPIVFQCGRFLNQRIQRINGFLELRQPQIKRGFLPENFLNLSVRSIESFLIVGGLHAHPYTSSEGKHAIKK